MQEENQPNAATEAAEESAHAPAEQTPDSETAAPAAEVPTEIPAVTAEITQLEIGEEAGTPAELKVEQPAAEETSSDAGEEAAEESSSEVFELLPTEEPGGGPGAEDADLKAIIEAVIYITDEPLTLQQIAAALNQPPDRIRNILDELQTDYEQPSRGLTIREVAGGYKMATKPEHHEAIRAFVKSLKPPLKLSLAALETLAVIAYKQPVTAPEIMEIRGVQGVGVLKTLIDRKLVATAGRKNVIGKPILYKTTKEFLVQFGLKDLSELPTLKEFEELGRLALNEPEPVEAAPAAEPVATEPAPAESLEPAAESNQEAGAPPVEPVEAPPVEEEEAKDA